jgi:hypothetical protein
MQRGGARKRRRVILRLAVGWLPPALPPSGACLHRGTRGPSARRRGFHPPGRRLLACPWAPLRQGAHTRKPSPTWSGGLARVRGPSRAMAQTPPPRSRALATVTPGACVPWAPRRWERVPSRPGACQRLSYRLGGWFARRLGRCRRTGAGARDAQAPSTRTRRAWGVPVVVLPSWARRGRWEPRCHEGSWLVRQIRGIALARTVFRPQKRTLLSCEAVRSLSTKSTFLPSNYLVLSLRINTPALQSASTPAMLSSHLERCRKRPTKNGAKIAYKKASSAISLSPASPPILKQSGIVLRGVLLQF